MYSSDYLCHVSCTMHYDMQYIIPELYVDNIYICFSNFKSCDLICIKCFRVMCVISQLTANNQFDFEFFSCSVTSKLASPQTAADKTHIGPVNLLPIFMYIISAKSSLKSPSIQWKSKSFRGDWLFDVSLSMCFRWRHGQECKPGSDGQAQPADGENDGPTGPTTDG